MAYAVKEVFKTLQGEGRNAGRAAVFCRFAGCNLWSGREADRADAVCRFCDTDFVGTDGSGGGKFETAQDLVDAIAQERPKTVEQMFRSAAAQEMAGRRELLIARLHEQGALTLDLNPEAVQFARQRLAALDRADLTSHSSTTPDAEPIQADLLSVPERR